MGEVTEKISGCSGNDVATQEQSQRHPFSACVTLHGGRLTRNLKKKI